ncbi:glycosyltransferase [Streptomyces sp. MST-110588]|uniref:glycosyltransferase n=1 Tax=Streptomyces sp. MST-110588 TaxID=2833628 RepID=UPI001F5CFB9F|nr:glycosyltransferase [Streptomyces sp. MST-110588]UNO40047.1 DUF3492 domain-containing protein [Streptomyces sp. MST-110588]
MRIGLLTEGGYPYASGESHGWCDRLVRGLTSHEFEVYALSWEARQEAWVRGDRGDQGNRNGRGGRRQGAEGAAGETPGRVRLVRTAPLWGELPDELRCRPEGRRGRGAGRHARRRFAEHFGDLATAFRTAGAGPGVRGAVNAGADRPGGGIGAYGTAGRSGGADTGPGGGGGTAARGADGTGGPATGAAPDAYRGAYEAERGTGAGAGTGGRTGHRTGTGEADRFASGLYGLAELARTCGDLPALLRSEQAVRILEAVCHAPGALRAAHGAQVRDLLSVTEQLERALRPLSLDWYGEDPAAGLGGVDLCHATSGGAAALPGLLTKRFFGTPLLVTECGVRLREHYLARAASPLSAPVRALLAAFQGALAAETYAGASLITPGNTHVRRWQERCGADRARLRTVYPGMDASPFTAVPDAAADDSKTLVWLGTVEPAKDLISLLHAFAKIHEAEPHATLRIVGAAGHGPQATAYLAHCRALAAQLFPDEAADALTVGENPVSFEEIGSPDAPCPQDAYAAGAVVVLSSTVEGFPRSLVEAMFCGRATVSTDAGAVCEIIGGTGLVVPPRNPRALADACLALLRDPERRARLGAAARARALELFTAEQNIAAFSSIYLELISHAPGRPAGRPVRDADGVPRLFARPAESHVPGRWAGGRGGGRAAAPSGRAPKWADTGPDGPVANSVSDSVPGPGPGPGLVPGPGPGPGSGPGLGPGLVPGAGPVSFPADTSTPPTTTTASAAASAWEAAATQGPVTVHGPACAPGTGDQGEGQGHDRT